MVLKIQHFEVARQNFSLGGLVVLDLGDLISCQFAIMSENDKIKFRGIIEFLVKEGTAPKEIHERLVKVYGDASPSYATVKNWAAEFKRGRVSLEDDPRSGRTSTSTSDEKVEAVEKLVLEDRRIKVAEIAQEVGISCGSVESILHDVLGFSKVCARWVPRNLTSKNMKSRVETSKAVLAEISQDKEGFFSRLITADETWIHHYDPESKQESMQWKHKESPEPKKFKTQPSAGKILATIFWDQEGIIMIDYLEHGKTITMDYYAELLRRLRQTVKEKRRGKLQLNPLLLHDNARVHTGHVAEAARKECGFELVPHPAYSPDLAPCDFFLFPDLKKHLRGKRYSSDMEVIRAVNQYFEGHPKEYYKQGLESLEKRLLKCVEVKGSYVEK